MGNPSPAVARFRTEFESAFEENRFAVFLCGPSISSGAPSSPAALLRIKLQKALLRENFDVVLGEDEGLEELRERYKGTADYNELEFVLNFAGAVVIIAGSPGSLCELGLFSHACLPLWSESDYRGDLVLIANSEYERQESYFNNGPAKSVDTLGGKVFYTDFSSFDCCKLIDRLMSRRVVWTNKVSRRRKNDK